ncbi:laccase-like multicopper oxidase, partial [Aureobasidium melanogenum]
MKAVTKLSAAVLWGSAVAYAWVPNFGKTSKRQGNPQYHDWNSTAPPSPSWPTTNYSSLPWFPNATLPQDVTNGLSPWGMLDHPGFGPWVNGPMPQGCPWGLRQQNDTNPYNEKNVPNTGMTRYYEWEVTNQTMAPDGVELPLLVVNGQFPGPLIEANWGDWIEVKITNNLNEGTAMHWHGFLQKGTPWYDGTPGISQCPIAPGKSFTYRFRAELYGTSWWHSHWSAQYLNGLAGPIIIHGPVADEYDIDLGPVMLTDWFHNNYFNLLEQVFFSTEFGPLFPPFANNMLINGKNNYDCKNTNLTCTPNAGISQFRFQSGKKHLLRLINHSAEAIVFFSIDGYQLKVVANDFVPVEPYYTDLVTLGVGQRTDIIVEATGNSTDAVWMRMTEGPSGLGPPQGQTGCSLNDGNGVEALAAIYYENADTSVPPTTTTTIAESRYYFPLSCNNQPLNYTVPKYPIPVQDPDVTLNFTMSASYNSTGAFLWYMNNQTFVIDYNDPILLEAGLGNIDFQPERRVFDMGTNKTVRIIMQSVGFPASHPMHIHGFNMQVLSEGLGTWDGVSITNPSNPQRRDTQLVQPNGYLVVQIELDNWGLWPFHCHIAWHISEGMNINLLVDTPYVTNEMEIPYVMAQTCRDWAEYTNTTVVNQIDSGL